MGEDHKLTAFFKYSNIPPVDNPRRCPVCGSDAPNGDVHRPHFGAISCYSCRAFFRRSVHCKTYKELSCKNGRPFIFIKVIKQHLLRDLACLATLVKKIDDFSAEKIAIHSVNWHFSVMKLTALFFLLFQC